MSLKCAGQTFGEKKIILGPCGGPWNDEWGEATMILNETGSCMYFSKYFSAKYKYF